MRYMSLCEICTPKQWPTLTLKQLSGKGFPVYGANGIIGYHDIYNHEQATVMIGCRGTCGQVTISEEKAYINGNAMCLDNLSDSYDKKFILYYLQNYDFSEIITGSSQPQITRESLKKVLIPIVSKEVQLNVVSHFDKLYELIVARRLQLAKLDQLVKSQFIELFGHPVANEMGWKKVPLSVCIKSIDNGKSFVCDTEPRHQDWPAVLKLSAATYGYYRPEENKALLDANQFVENAAVHTGDLLFTRKNTPELVGMCAYVYDTPKGLMMPDLIFRLNTTEKCNKIFLWKLINHDLFRDCIQAIATGSAKSMSNISKERLLNLEVILPPLELQKQFAAFVEQTDKSKLAIQQSLDKLETLKKSLMQEYFG